MNKNDYIEIFLNTLPRVLKQDNEIYTLAKMVAKELGYNVTNINKNIIYANIEHLNEDILDMLAYDLHVDWYNYSADIEVKRRLIRNSVLVHKKMGTKFAVETVLRDIYETAIIEEWFEYGGKPYEFRIKLLIEKDLKEHEICDLIRKMFFYKNLRSHCIELRVILKGTLAETRIINISKTRNKIKIKSHLHDTVNTNIPLIFKNKRVIYEVLKIKTYLEKTLSSRSVLKNSLISKCKEKVIIK